MRGSEKRAPGAEAEEARQQLLAAAKCLQQREQQQSRKTRTRTLPATPSSAAPKARRRVLEAPPGPTITYTPLGMTTVAELVAGIEAVACSACASRDDEAAMLLCDGCARGGMHMYCCSPPLATVPEGDWYCSEACRRQGKWIAVPVGEALALPLASPRPGVAWKSRAQPFLPTADALRAPKPMRTPSATWAGSEGMPRSRVPLSRSCPLPMVDADGELEGQQQEGPYEAPPVRTPKPKRLKLRDTRAEAVCPRPRQPVAGVGDSVRRARPTPPGRGWVGG